MILREITVLEAIEGAFGTFAEEIHPMWCVQSVTEPVLAGSFSPQDLVDILSEDEGELE